jgi:chemotaxis protein MotA
MLLGIGISVAALAAAIVLTGISARYFLQPASILIVAGGTLGVMLITTPLRTLLSTFRHSVSLFAVPASPGREEIIDEIVCHAQAVRVRGIPALEPGIVNVSDPFLRDAFLLALDVTSRQELQSALESKIRSFERQSETAARVLEVAGGLTPTLGVLGTVVGLIDVLRQFSVVTAAAAGVGAAFTSTFYGLALANIILLPVANRIRARAADTFDLQELMMEGALCLFDGLHPLQIRQRLRPQSSFPRDTRLRPVDSRNEAA